MSNFLIFKIYNPKFFACCVEHRSVKTIIIYDGVENKRELAKILPKKKIQMIYEVAFFGCSYFVTHIFKWLI